MANGHEFTVDCNGQIQFATQYTNETLWLLEETCGSDANIVTQKFHRSELKHICFEYLMLESKYAQM